MEKEPLGAPRGSVRAVLALMLVAGFLAPQGVAVWWLLEAGEYEVAVALLGGLQSMAGVVLAFYFAQRPGPQPQQPPPPEEPLPNLLERA